MTHHRGRVVVAGAAAIILVAVGFVYLRGASTPVSLDSAVKEFRVQDRARPTTRPGPKTTTATTGRAEESSPSVRVPVTVSSRTARSDSVRPLPAEGVYVYATTGGDDVDVLGGSRHEYPDRTTITVRHSGCGLIERWDVLKERWDERESCRTRGGDLLRRLTSYHEFFRHGDVRDFRCSGFSHPVHDTPGTTWTVRCVTSTTTTVTNLRVVGPENVIVERKAVRTLHIHATSRLTGDQQGSSERDVWGAANWGVVVRERARVDSNSMQPVFGKTHYHEQYEIRLLSLTPRR